MLRMTRGSRHNAQSAGHRADCPSCREENDRLESSLAGFRDIARTAAERPEYFWDRQRHAIRDALRSTRHIRGYGSTWAWVSATVVVLLALTLFVPRGEPVVPDIAAGQDQELLLSIESSLNRQVPAILEPALILTTELEKAASQSTKK